MRINSGLLAVETGQPLRGLNTSTPSSQLDPAYSPKMSNMLIQDGRAFKRSGYYEFIDQDLDGNVHLVIDFIELDGTETLVAITTTRQYKFDEGEDEWADITATRSSHLIQDVDDSGPDFFKISGNHTSTFIVGAQFTVTGSTANDDDYAITAVAYDSGTNLTQITVADIAGDDTADGSIEGVFYPIILVSTASDIFIVAGVHTSIFTSGTKIIVEGSTGNDGEWTVDSSSEVAGNTWITVEEDVKDSTANGNIEVLQVLTTTGTDYFDWVVGTDNNNHRLYVTNGRDRVVFWDGDADRFLVWYPEYPDFVTCETIEVFYDHLVLGNVTLASGNPKLVAWSDTTNFDEFEDSNAGSLLIPGLDGAITRLEPLGDRLVVYSDNSVAMMTFLGPPIIFSVEVLLQGTRLVSGLGVVSFGSAHLYCSQENIYFFDGTRGIRSVGDKIRKLYKQDIDLEYGSRLFAFNDVAKRVIFIVVPTSSTESVVYIIAYDIFNLRDFKWTRVEFTDRPQGFGFFARRDFPSWEDPPDINWEDDYGAWYEEGERVAFPVRMMGSGSKVFIADETAGEDDDTAVTAYYETPDFTLPQIKKSQNARWLEIEADLDGMEVDVLYSTNGGSAWVTVESGVSLNTNPTHHRFPIVVTSRTIRVRFESTKFFALQWLRVWGKPHSAR